MLSIKLVTRQYNSYNYGGGQNSYGSNSGGRRNQNYNAPAPLPMGNGGQGNYGQRQAQGYGQPQNFNGGRDFDYYALVVDWPEMICRDLNNSGKKCTMPNDVEDWTIKGLWPQKNNGLGARITKSFHSKIFSWPSLTRIHPRDCTNDHFDFQQFYYRSQQNVQDIKRKWVNLQCNRRVCGGEKFYTDLIQVRKNNRRFHYKPKLHQT